MSAIQHLINAIASLRMEGVEPSIDGIILALKIIDGQITVDDAIEEVLKEYTEVKDE